MFNHLRLDRSRLQRGEAVAFVCLVASVVIMMAVMLAALSYPDRLRPSRLPL